MGVLRASTAATPNAVKSGARNPQPALRHFLKMLTYCTYAPLFRKHRALAANPSLALNKVGNNKDSFGCFFVSKCNSRLYCLD